MFGYITVNREELKLKDFERYQAYYCGLCEELRKRYGYAGQATLTYDMTFLAVLLTGLYEVPTEEQYTHCTKHLGKKHKILTNDVICYAADMNVLLSYYDFLDDWIDEKKITKYTIAKVLEKAYQKIAEKYPRQQKAVLEYVNQLEKWEKDRKEDLDQAAGLTGTLLGEIFVWRQDEWEDILRHMGFYMGKFIYLMDAFEDLEKDKEKGCFNPLLSLSEQEDFAVICNQILTLMAAESAREFEKLPVILDAEIIRNILYSGIWAKYEAVKKKRMEGK